MKRLRIRDRNNDHTAPRPGRSTDIDPAADFGAPLVDPVGLDEVWGLADAADSDMSGDAIRQALGIQPVEPLGQPVSDLVPEASGESLSWLESVPSATSTSELAAFISEGQPPAPRTLAGGQPWVVSIGELAEATGTTPSACRPAAAVPDLEIDWDAVATVPRVTARRSAGRWQRRIQSESDRRTAAEPDMSDTDVGRLREVLDESPVPTQRRSA